MPPKKEINFFEPLRHIYCPYCFVKATVNFTREKMLFGSCPSMPHPMYVPSNIFELEIKCTQCSNCVAADISTLEDPIKIKKMVEDCVDVFRERNDRIKTDLKHIIRVERPFLQKSSWPGSITRQDI